MAVAGYLHTISKARSQIVLEADGIVAIPATG